MSTVAFEQCLICNKETFVGVNGWRENGDLWKKFCVLVSRYLNLSSTSALYSQWRVLKTFGTENENVICDLCSQFVTWFCDNYEEWKNAELRLNWSLRMVTQLMKRAKVNVSSSASCSKSQPKPKCRRSKAENVLEFKRDLLVHYDLHSSKEFPQLNLSKINLDDHEQSEEVKSPSDVNVKLEIPEFHDFDLKFEPDAEFDPDVAIEDYSAGEEEFLMAPPSPTSPSSSLPEPNSSPESEGHTMQIVQGSSRSKVKSEIEVEPEPGHDHDKGDKKKSKCRYCGKAFPNRQRTFIHEFQHTGQQPFQCAICSKKFNDPNACHRHLKTVHKEKDKTKMIVENLEIAKVVFVGAYKNKSTVCSFCGKEFHTYVNRKRHESRHKRNMSKVDEPLICKFCGREFNHLRSLRKHENVHIRALQNTAKLSPPRTPSPTKVNKDEVNVKVTDLIHTERQENENADLSLEEKQLQSAGSTVKLPFLCKFCGKEFQNQGSLRRHETLHVKYGGPRTRGRKPKTPKTPQKSRVNKTKTEVNDNEVEVNKETSEDKLDSKSTSKMKVRKFKCQHCDKKFYQRRSQIIHQLQHTDQFPFQCIPCSRKFKDPSSCLRHIKTTHKIGATEDQKSQMFIESEETAKQFFKRDNMDKSLICTFCGKTFETYQKRGEHERRYHIYEKRQYQCSTCGKEVASLKNLRRHEILHTGLKPFKCRKGCGKAFSDDSSRKTHEDNVRHLEDGTCVRKISNRVYLRKPGSKYRYRKRRPKKTVIEKDVAANTVEMEAEAEMDVKVDDYNQEGSLLLENENVEVSEQKVNLDTVE